jgi:hypothetical protein
MATAGGFSERHSAQAQRLARAAAALGAEIRQREKQAEDDANANSPAQELDDLFAHLGGLPGPMRSDFVARLVQMETELTSPKQETRPVTTAPNDERGTARTTPERRNG